MRKNLVAGTLFALALTFSGMAGAAPGTQKPFTGTEFEKFIKDYSAVTTWLAKQKNGQGLVRNPWVLSGMRYNPAFLNHLKEMGWSGDRFFYLLDRINTGLLSGRADEHRAKAKARRAERMKQMEARMAEGRKRMAEGRKRMARGQNIASDRAAQREKARIAMQQKMSKRNAAQQARMLKHLASQRARIQNNRHINPQQKQRMLAQLDQNRKRWSQPPTAPKPGEMRKKMAQQQAKWLADQERRIRNNPYMPPQQKRMALASLKQARQQPKMPDMTPPKRPAPPKSYEEAVAASQAEQRKMLDQHRKRIGSNPHFPAAQKKRMLAQIDEMAKRMAESGQKPAAAAAPAAPSLIPETELNLIKKNRKKLLGIFFPEK